jgi:hypothetical protein
LVGIGSVLVSEYRSDDTCFLVQAHQVEGDAQDAEAEFCLL